jgi:hypothetical protein
VDWANSHLANCSHLSDPAVNVAVGRCWNLEQQALFLLLFTY